MLANARWNLAQPANDLRLLLRKWIAREGGREILLEQQRRLAPCGRERARRECVLVIAEWFLKPWQMVLHRWDREQSAAAREIATHPHEREIVVEGPVPPSALPGHGPAGAAPLDFHFRFMNRPCRHRLRTRGILRDDGLQDHKREARIPIGLELCGVERQLPGSLPHRMRNRFAQVACGEIDAIRLADVGGKVARQVPFEALEIPLELRAWITWQNARDGIERPAVLRPGPPSPRALRPRVHA